MMRNRILACKAHPAILQTLHLTMIGKRTLQDDERAYAKEYCDIVDGEGYSEFDDNIKSIMPLGLELAPVIRAKDTESS